MNQLPQEQCMVPLKHTPSVSLTLDSKLSLTSHVPVKDAWMLELSTTFYTARQYCHAAPDGRGTTTASWSRLLLHACSKDATPRRSQKTLVKRAVTWGRPRLRSVQTWLRLTGQHGCICGLQPVAGAPMHAGRAFHVAPQSKQMTNCACV